MSKILNLRKKPIKTPPPPETRANSAEQDSGWQKQKEEIKWEALSFYYNPQKKYLVPIIVILLAGAAALMMFKYDILTSVFLALSAIVIFLYSRQKPTLSKITVDRTGVCMDDIIYYYKDLKSFWIEYSPGGSKELSLESAKWYMPYIKILLDEQNPIEVRSLIVNFLPEKEHEFSLVNHIGRKIGL